MKDFKLNMSDIKKVRDIEEGYSKQGEERLDVLLELSSQQKLSSEYRGWFILGYSECGQDMHTIIEENEKLKKNKKVNHRN